MPASNRTNQGGGFWSYADATELPATGLPITIVPAIGPAGTGMTPIIRKLHITALMAGGGAGVTVRFNNGSTTRVVASPVCDTVAAAGLAKLDYNSVDMEAVGRPGDRIEVVVALGVAISSFYMDGYRDALNTQEV